jgi:hypothetical protein
MHENSDFAMKINEINIELSGNSQTYVNECCDSESDGKSIVSVLVVANAGGGFTIAM